MTFGVIKILENIKKRLIIENFVIQSTQFTLSLCILQGREFLGNECREYLFDSSPSRAYSYSRVFLLFLICLESYTLNRSACHCCVENLFIGDFCK